MSKKSARPGIARRQTLQAGIAMAALAVTAGQASAQTRKVTKVLDFETSADIAKAEEEGQFVFYTHDSDPAGAAVAEAFNKDFPKIKASYFRAQNGALYSKLLAERSAGRFNVDVVQFSEVSTALDFQKRGGWERYESSHIAAYDAASLSSPPGDYFFPGVLFGGIAYNTDKVSAAEAPKTWKDLVDPKWRNGVNCKQATSGMQFVQWYELRRLYGDDYWKEFAKLRPRGFDSRAQLWDRLSKGDDKICGLAEYAGYLLFKERGAPIAFVVPPDGMPATPVATGLVKNAPHPEAGRLFVDWLMSLRGQALYQTNPYLYYGSMRKDAPAMPDGKRLVDYKLLIPQDLKAYSDSHETFVKEWNGMLGL